MKDDIYLGKNVHIKIEIETKDNTTAPYLDTDLKECKVKTTLSISGNIGQDCAGQIQDEVASLFPDNDKIQRLVEIWNRYHLNDLSAGTNKQREFIEKYKADNPWAKNYSDSYDLYCHELKSVDLYEDRGYKYGTAWLCETIPTEIIEELKELIEVLKNGK